MADHDAARYFAGIVNRDKHVRAGPSFGETEVATGSLYHATRSQARHSAPTACSSSATALLTVSNIRCLALCATLMFAYRETARNGLSD
ncbi:MAG: hypothetical protein WB611_08155 [Stellaceae bacterium]